MFVYPAFGLLEEESDNPSYLILGTMRQAIGLNSKIGFYVVFCKSKSLI